MISERGPTFISVDFKNVLVRTLSEVSPVSLIAVEQIVRLKAQVG